MSNWPLYQYFFNNALLTPNTSINNINKGVPYLFCVVQTVAYLTPLFVVHDDVIKWKHFPRNWPFVRGIHRSPTQRPVTRSFDVFSDLRLNKRLSKQTQSWWFETQSWSLWRHCNAKKGLLRRRRHFKFAGMCFVIICHNQPMGPVVNTNINIAKIMVDA